MDSGESDAFDPGLMNEPAEKALVKAEACFRTKMAEALPRDDFKSAFETIADLRGPIDDFLTDIMVMCDDESLKMSRLGLLRSINNGMLEVADFTQIVAK